MTERPTQRTRLGLLGAVAVTLSCTIDNPNIVGAADTESNEDSRGESATSTGSQGESDSTGSGGQEEAGSTDEATVCGDGIVDEDEECDEGEDNGDGNDCLSNCLLASCGDGFLHHDEVCDDGNGVNDDGCTNLCALPECGDGIVQEGESCDDGNAKDDDSCLTTCVAASCGDGFVWMGEEYCDDGNNDNDDQCAGDCQATCGAFDVPEVTLLRYIQNSPEGDLNYGSNVAVQVLAWTWYGSGWGPGYSRTLLNFDAELFATLEGQQVVDFTLHLYTGDSESLQHADPDTFSPNDASCFVVTEAWDEMTVSPNTFVGGNPNEGFDPDPVCSIAATEDPAQDLAIDLLSYGELVALGGGANGILIKLNTEVHYRRLAALSDDAEDVDRRPRVTACWRAGG